ncbi:PIN domain-containing protein [Geoglobus acetivorans]|nr:PIN domain-containing protein [Geoglobus acetivorans]
MFRLCFSEEIELIGNSILLAEFKKYEKLLGKSGRILLEIIRDRIQLIEPDYESIEVCKRFMPENEFADLYHASTCLKAEAVMITNDKHFDKIKKAGLIRVWSISEAIKELL